MSSALLIVRQSAECTVFPICSFVLDQLAVLVDVMWKRNPPSVENMFVLLAGKLLIHRLLSTASERSGRQTDRLASIATYIYTEPCPSSSSSLLPTSIVEYASECHDNRSSLLRFVCSSVTEASHVISIQPARSDSTHSTRRPKK